MVRCTVLQPSGKVEERLKYRLENRENTTGKSRIRMRIRSKTVQIQYITVLYLNSHMAVTDQERDRLKHREHRRQSLTVSGSKRGIG